MILGSLLLKREGLLYMALCGGLFFIKMGYRGIRRRSGIPKKRKNYSADYAHSARGGHLKSFCAIKKAAAQNNVQRPFAILLCTLCALNLGGSGGSSLRRSSLAGSGLRGSSSARSRTTASGHASSQSQSNNSDANILEFHINDLLSLLVNVWQRAFGSTSLRCYILIRF